MITKLSARSKQLRLLNFYDENNGIEIYTSDDISDECNEVRSPDLFQDENGVISILVIARTNNTPIGVYSATTTNDNILTWTDMGKVINDNGNLIYSASHVKVNGMWYVMCDYANVGKFYLYTGTSLTGLTAHGNNPVFSGAGSGSEWEKYVRHPKLLYKDGTFFCFYDGRTGSNPRDVNGGVGFATSTDCVTWVRHPSNPIALHNTGWYHNYQHGVTITKIRSWYYMIFGDTNYIDNPPQWLDESTACFKSKDLINWISLTPEAGQVDNKAAGSQRDLFYNYYDKKTYSFGNVVLSGLRSRSAI